MKPYREPGRSTWKVRLYLPDGRRRTCTLGTDSKPTALAMVRFVEQLRSDRRWDLLGAIAEGMVTLPFVYDHRQQLEKVVATLDDLDVAPYVAQWHAGKLKAKKGAGSADRYLKQVRRLIPVGKPFPRSRFTRKTIDEHLTGLAVEDPTRNRHRAAFMSFAKYLVRRDVLASNIVRDIEGWSEGDGRIQHYERADAQKLIAALPQPFQAIEALMVGAGLEWQAIERLRVADVTLSATPTVYARGGKSRWRNRLCRIVEPWTVPYIRPALAGKLPSALVFDGADNRRALEQHGKAIAAVKVDASTLHDWRHTHAVLMLRDGYKPTTVAHQLGHRDTTLVWQRYGRFIVDERDYERSAHPHTHPEVKENIT